MLTITFVSVSENTATGGEFGFGSGIGNVGGMLVLQCSSVIDNTADNSGGIANVDGTTTIINSTIGGNEAVNAVGVSLTSQARPTSRQHCN